MDVREALKAAAYEPDPKKGLNGHMMAYARRAIQDNMTGDALYDQILYIISNCQHWCGEKAKEAKAVLRQYIKDNKPW